MLNFLIRSITFLTSYVLITSLSSKYINLYTSHLADQRALNSRNQKDVWANQFVLGLHWLKNFAIFSPFLVKNIFICGMVVFCAFIQTHKCISPSPSRIKPWANLYVPFSQIMDHFSGAIYSLRHKYKVCNIGISSPWGHLERKPNFTGLKQRVWFN